MIPFFRPDLKENIVNTIYALFLHNFLAIFYALGMGMSLLYALYRPSRSTFLLFVGFTLLLFAFEYTKHIAQPLNEQTLNSLITIQFHDKVYKLVRLFILRAVPVALPLLGWGLVISSSYTILKKRHHYVKKLK